MRRSHDLSLAEKLKLKKDLKKESKQYHDIYPSWWAEDNELIRDARGDPSPPDPWQEVFLDSPLKRKILNIHRQAGKSAMASLKCLHKAKFKPGSLSLIIAPSLRQSQENFIAIRRAIDLLPDPPDFDQLTKLSLQTDKGSRILCLPGGNEGTTIRGFSRPDIIVEDESSRCSDTLHEAIVPMMTAYPECELILASTPFGQRGHFYLIYTEADPKVWLKLKLRAQDNPRISRAFLEEQRNSGISPFYYAQEFDCEFVGSENQLISHEMIQESFDQRLPILVLD